MRREEFAVIHGGMLIRLSPSRSGKTDPGRLRAEPLIHPVEKAAERSQASALRAKALAIWIFRPPLPPRYTGCTYIET